MFFWPELVDMEGRVESCPDGPEMIKNEDEKIKYRCYGLPLGKERVEVSSTGTVIFYESVIFQAHIIIH